MKISGEVLKLTPGIRIHSKYLRQYEIIHHESSKYWYNYVETNFVKSWCRKINEVVWEYENCTVVSLTLDYQVYPTVYDWQITSDKYYCLVILTDIALKLRTLTNRLLTCFDGAEAERLQTFCMLQHDWRIDEFQCENVQSDKSCKANENKRCLLNQHGNIDIWGEICSLQRGIRVFYVWNKI